MRDAMLNRWIFSVQALSRFSPYLPDEDARRIKLAFEWIEPEMTRVVQKRPKVKEAVCPFVQPSLEAGLFYFALAEPNPTLEPVKAVEMELRHFTPWFATMAPAEGNQKRLRTLVIVFPDAYEPYLHQAIDTKTSSAKTDLIAQGLMMGEFYQSCPFSATWDPQSFPLRSPVPFYALRTLIETDWRFIKAEPEWQALYIRQFGQPNAKISSLGESKCPITRAKRWVKSWLKQWF